MDKKLSSPNRSNKKNSGKKNKSSSNNKPNQEKKRSERKKSDKKLNDDNTSKEKKLVKKSEKKTSKEKKKNFHSKEKPFKKKSLDKKHKAETKETKEYKTLTKDKNNKNFRENKKTDKKNYAKKTEKANNQNKGKDFNKQKNNEKTLKLTKKSKDSESIRLNKYIANAGICSRREADKMIKSGVISVNGQIVTQLGTKIKPGDIVKYDNRILKNEKKVYILLNKPKDYLTTTKDPQNRKTVMDLVRNACKENIYPVGRLDRATTGLLLFTNDGEIAEKLMHPKNRIRKVYHVTLDKALTRNDMEAIAKGIELEDGIAEVDVIAYVGDESDKKEIGIELHSGKNRIVRRIFEHLGYKVLKLDRVVFAGLTKKDLPRGRWRFLTEQEINLLHRI